VVDLTRVMAGPFASMMLSDLGADVVKVEAAGVGDVMRHMGGHKRGGFNAIFLGLNRGKRSISVDLTRSEGKEVVRDLASQADVFLENFRPGVCDAMDLGPDQVRGANPQLVYVSISGYGPESPASADPAYDTIVQGRSGMVARQRNGEIGQPDLVRSFLVDKITAFFAVQGVLAALYARERGGSGEHLCVPMMDAALYYLWPDSMTDQTFVGDGVTPGPLFSLANNLTETSNGYLTHMALSDRERAGVNRAVRRADLSDDPRFATTAALHASGSRHEYYEAVAEGFRALTTDEALHRLREEGVPCSGVAEPPEVVEDPHVIATGVLCEWDHPSAGRIRQPRHPVLYGGAPAPMRSGAPRIGQHTREVLVEAGYDVRDIDQLASEGILGGTDA
jgi:crotonobetainyl-CoA:carnitine CoA-transferase CaiB-like acyl-CoA transferase